MGDLWELTNLGNGVATSARGLPSRLCTSSRRFKTLGRTKSRFFCRVGLGSPKESDEELYCGISEQSRAKAFGRQRANSKLPALWN